MRFVDCEIKSIGPIFKTRALIYQSKANLDENILLGKITDYLDPEIRKMLVKGKLGNEDYTFLSGPRFTCYQNQNYISEADNINAT